MRPHTVGLRLNRAERPFPVGVAVMTRSDTLTCAQIAKAQLFELAHLDRFGRLRHPITLDAEALRRHVAGCADCRRWYDNALRALDPLPAERDTAVTEGDTAEPPPQC